MVPQVARVEPAPLGLDAVGDGLRRLPAIELIGPPFGDPAEGACQVGLPTDLAGARPPAAGEIDERRFLIGLQTAGQSAPLPGDEGTDGEAFFRILDGRPQRRLPRERAIGGEQLIPGVDAAGHGDGEGAGLGDLLPPLCAQCLRVSGCRRAAAAIEGAHAPVIGPAHQGKGVAARAGRCRLDDIQHARHDDGGVCRIAAGLQDAQAGLRRERLARGDHAVPGEYRGAVGTEAADWTVHGSDTSLLSMDRFCAILWPVLFLHPDTTWRTIMARTVRIITKNSLCSGCLSCMSTCSLRNERHVSPASARIQVEVDVFGGDNKITICRQCKDPDCVRACPVGAIYRDEGLQIWRVDYELCIGCRECVSACRFSSMFFDPNGDKVIKCEQCSGSGEPSCVDVCPTGALTLRVTEG